MAVSEGAKLKESNMQFVVSKQNLQRELAYVQGVVEKKNTIPVLSNILIESVGENNIRLTGTDLDVTIRCDMDAEVSTAGSICVQARKLFEIARLLPDAPVTFKKESNDWVTVTCDKAKFKMVGVARDAFPEVPSSKSTPTKLAAEIIKSFIDKTIFAITQEESRYTLSGAKFIMDDSGAKMVTTDGHRLAYVERKGVSKDGSEAIDTLIPRKTLAELTKLTAGFEGEISLGLDNNHIFFEVGPRLLVSRMLYGQFPNYDMVMPKNNDKSVQFDCGLLNSAVRRVALMSDERSHAIRFHIEPNQLVISSQNAEEGEASETIQADYSGEETDIGFNAQYLLEFLNVIGDGAVAFEFKDGNSQAQLRPAEAGDYDYKYVVMPMRL
ncbi:MAG TPA: DNA polymerase III subunit beta [Pyrinomonadaceae bacterium]|jgi:DNA polymerase-3 subunit beta|nr:DNA polymerase III subunit beta [Pyrinomonadaceae bacterium]